jgi:addiction module HigA family antidote
MRQAGQFEEADPVSEEIVRYGRRPTGRRPIHPGEMLLEEYLKPLGMSVTAAARDLGVSQQLLSQIVRGDGPITARTAVRLERLFGASAEFWLSLQQKWDLWHELRRSERDLTKIKPLKAGGT